MANRTVATLLGVGLIALSAAHGLAAQPQADATTLPKRVDLVYAVYASGFHVLDAQAYHLQQGDRYEIGAGARTEGFLNWLFSWQGSTSSVGYLKGQTAVPEKHENWGQYNGSERRILVTYDRTGGVQSVVRDPEPNWEKFFPLPDDAADGTIDPLSLIAQMTARIDSGGTCDGSFPVFDGKRRYDLYAVDKGVEELPDNGYSIYRGTALKCRIDYKMLGGNRREVSDVAKSARNRDIWIAQVIEGGPYIPVRVQVETSFGPVIGHLIEVQYGDHIVTLETDS